MCLYNPIDLEILKKINTKFEKKSLSNYSITIYKDYRDDCFVVKMREKILPEELNTIRDLYQVIKTNFNSNSIYIKL